MDFPEPNAYGSQETKIRNLSWMVAVSPKIGTLTDIGVASTTESMTSRGFDSPRLH